MNENEMIEQDVTYEKTVELVRQNKKGILIGAAALAVIAIIVALAVGILSNSPMGLLAAGFSNSMEALEDNSYIEMMEQVSNGGSVELAMDITPILQGNGLPGNGTGALKIYMDQEEQEAAMTLGVQVGGQTLDASLFGNQKGIAVASDWLLGDKAYGIGLKDFVENFNNSVFGPNGAYSLDIEIPENFQEQLERSKDYNKATEKIAMQLAAQLLKSAEKNSNVAKENATLEMGDETVKTTAVSIKMDHNQLAAVVEEMLDYLRTDKDIKAYLYEYKDILFGGSDLDTEAMLDELYEELEDAKDEIGELKEEMEDEEAGLEAVFYITKSGKQLIGMDITLESNISPAKLSFYAGPDLQEAKEISFRVEADDTTVRGSYTVTTNNKTAYAAELKIRADGENLVNGTVTWDKKNGDFAVTATNLEGVSVGFRGKLEQSKKEITLNLQSIEADGQKVELDMDLVLRASDKMPAMPNYTEILKLTEEEVTTIVNDLSMVFFQMAYGMV